MRFENILALTDLSANASHGLRLAESLARRFHARITIGYVHTRLDILRDFGGNDKNAVRLREWVREEDNERLAAQAAQHIEPLRLAGIETIHVDSAREGVELLAKRVRPDLICMSTRGRTGLASVLLGSVAEHTIRTAECPVVVTHAYRFPEPDAGLKVLLGIDMVDEPDPLVRRVGSLLSDKDELVLVHVVESMFVSLAAYGSHLALPQPDVSLLTEAVRERLESIEPQPGAPRPSVEIGVGRPSDVLLSIARDRDVDLIVTRTHGRRGFDQLMLGSVSERIARRAKVAVLVLPKLD